ncbi:MAG: DUF2007 domain-containing protein [Acidimicrobiia bacterium]
MLCVYTASHPTDAHLLRGLLEAEGITAIVQGEALFGVRGEVPVSFDTLPTVWVLNDAELDRARAIVVDYSHRADVPTSSPTWECPTCHEQVDEQLFQCWNCGSSRESGSKAT